MRTSSAVLILAAAVLLASGLHRGIYEFATSEPGSRVVWRVNRFTGTFMVCAAKSPPRKPDETPEEAKFDEFLASVSGLNDADRRAELAKHGITEEEYKQIIAEQNAQQAALNHFTLTCSDPTR